MTFDYLKLLNTSRGRLDRDATLPLVLSTIITDIVSRTEISFQKSKPNFTQCIEIHTT